MPTRTGKIAVSKQPFALGLPLMIAGWALMWGVESYWNPLVFAAMWTGAALVMWAIGRGGYPGLRVHLILAAISVPLWWWFELVNARTRNWHYVYETDYSAFEFAVLSSIAFGTVVPAIVAACSLVRPFFQGQFGGRKPARPTARPANPRGVSTGRGPRRVPWAYPVVAGVSLHALVFAFPTYFYPFEWVAPFLVVDGLLARFRGTSLIGHLLNPRNGGWREPVAIGCAGLLCGFLWEFWNFWSSPHWEYSVPLVGFWKVFEMPLLGYAGYIPFAWSVVQLVRLAGAGVDGSFRYGSPRHAPPGPPL